MASGRVRAKYNLAKDVRQSDNVLKSSAQQAADQNDAAADSSFWGRLTGSGIGVAAGLGLGILTGGTSLALTAALAGAGSFLGSKAGEELAGGIDTTVESGGFGKDKVADMNKSLEDYETGVKQDRLLNAGSDAFSVYTAGGGLYGGGIGGGTKYFATDAMGKEVAKSAAEQAGHSMFRAQAQQLAFGVGKQQATKLGLGTYEAYIKDNV
tara:strand:- start:1448 stop:2077 length:630 start_codon:yes stop_codon:yes gene_type:complete